MRLARYRTGGRLLIEEEPAPSLPPGGLIVRSLACGLCSGELMEWYLDQKAPHVIGHEVCGIVIQSDHPDFPVGVQVSPHHHAPCGNCEFCLAELFVHCPTWKATRLLPGGMSEVFAVSADLLPDCHITDGIDPQDAALAEPLACVIKSIRRGRYAEGDRVAVIGLGALGIMHALMLPGCTGFEVNTERIAYARSLDIEAHEKPGEDKFDLIFVLPGAPQALESAMAITRPGARIVLFAPMPAGTKVPIDLNYAYFADLEMINSYSCGPKDMVAAVLALREGKISAKQVVSDFVTLDELPHAYTAMRDGKIMKAMVRFQ